MSTTVLSVRVSQEERAILEAASEQAHTSPTVSPHDLRRTVATETARLGIPVHIRSLVLNHSPQSRGVTDAVYNRYAYDKEKREALLAWEQRFDELMTAAGGNNYDVINQQVSQIATVI